jgi:hypothetical protein
VSHQNRAGLDDREYRSSMGVTHSPLPQVPNQRTRASSRVKQTLIATLLSFAAASVALRQALPNITRSTRTPLHVLDGTATANSVGSYLDTVRAYVCEGAGDPGSFYDVYLHSPGHRV